LTSLARTGRAEDAPCLNDDGDLAWKGVGRKDAATGPSLALLRVWYDGPQLEWRSRWLTKSGLPCLRGLPACPAMRKVPGPGSVLVLARRYPVAGAMGIWPE
jgi:hypothetical protein